MADRARADELDRQEGNASALRALGLDGRLCDDRSLILLLRDPASDRYNAARQLHGPRFDAFPSLIATCFDPDDVRAALSIAKAAGLPVTCKSGGHSTAGYSVRDDAMLLDLRPMRRDEVDKHTRRARFGAGLPFRDVNFSLGLRGLHIPGGACNTVCIGGFVQGGGYGFTSRIFGMNIDNVRSFRMMLADGRIATASRDQNYDLFWAVRGGTGNNFGVLLDVEYDLHDIDTLHGFGLIWDLEDSSVVERIPAILQLLQRDHMATGEPAKAGYMLAFRKLDQRLALLMRGVYHGEADDARAWLDRLLRETGGVLEIERYESYKDVEAIMMEQYHIDPDGLEGAKEDKQSGYIEKLLTQEDWRSVLDYIRGAGPILNFVVIEPYGGRIAEIPASDSAFVHRSVHMNFYVDVWWHTDAERAPAVAWLDAFMDRMQPHFNGMTYQNYPRATFKDYPLAYWGIDAYTELVAIKKKYDPEGFFTFPQAIGRWPGFQPSDGVGDPKLTAAIRSGDIVVEAGQAFTARPLPAAS